MHFRKPAGNVTFIVWGSLQLINHGAYLDQSVVQLYFLKTLPVTSPLNIYNLSFKRNFFFFYCLPKSSVLNLSQNSPHVSMWVICVCVTHTQTMTHFPIIVKKVVFKLPPQKSNFVGNTITWGFLRHFSPQGLPDHNYHACVCLEDLRFATRTHLGQPLNYKNLQSVTCYLSTCPPTQTIDPSTLKCACFFFSARLQRTINSRLSLRERNKIKLVEPPICKINSSSSY